MDANFNLLAEEWYASIRANATTGSSIIKGPGSGAGGTSERASCWRNWSWDVCGILTRKSREGKAVVCKVAREDTIPERRNQSKEFVVSPTWIKSSLKNKVRSLVVCVGPGRIVKPCAQPWRADQEIVKSRSRYGRRGHRRSSSR